MTSKIALKCKGRIKVSNAIELKLKSGFNIIVVFYEKYLETNEIKAVAFDEISAMFDFICQTDKTVITVYFAVCNAEGGILRGIAVPKSVRYRDYYEYKKKLHLEFCHE